MQSHSHDTLPTVKACTLAAAALGFLSKLHTAWQSLWLKSKRGGETGTILPIRPCLCQLGNLQNVLVVHYVVFATGLEQAADTAATGTRFL